MPGTGEDPEEKLRVIRDSLRDAPDDPARHYLLGVELAKMGRHLDAIEAFERSIRLAPNYVAAYRELGKSLRDTGRRREAEEVLGRGVEVAQRTKDAGTLKDLLMILKRMKESQA